MNGGRCAPNTFDEAATATVTSVPRSLFTPVSGEEKPSATAVKLMADG
jgi:hypothetical protein